VKPETISLEADGLRWSRGVLDLLSAMKGRVAEWPAFVAEVFHPGGEARAAVALRQRILRVLGIFAARGYDSLVLGAWGCGAFGNDPVTTARDFREALAGAFCGAFADVVFAVADWSPEHRFLGPFRDAFAPGGR
jgi:uncharacterized protein (TIGR02452 family)